VLECSALISSEMPDVFEEHHRFYFLATKPQRPQKLLPPWWSFILTLLKNSDPIYSQMSRGNASRQVKYIFDFRCGLLSYFGDEIVAEELTV
jgi:hypothetical protein